MNLEERVVKLEALFMHQQKLVQDLDKVVFEQAKKIDQLQRDLKLLVGEIRQLRDGAREGRRPEEEIPPHY
jgi:SlyX protein